jgi:hypothetical protein
MLTAMKPWNVGLYGIGILAMAAVIVFVVLLLRRR